MAAPEQRDLDDLSKHNWSSPMLLPLTMSSSIPRPSGTCPAFDISFHLPEVGIKLNPGDAETKSVTARVNVCGRAS